MSKIVARDKVIMEEEEEGRQDLGRARGRQKVRGSRVGSKGMHVMRQQSEERSIVRNETVGGVDGHVENVQLERSASGGEILSKSREQCDEIQ